MRSIKEKLTLSEKENADVVANNVGNNQYEISFKTADAITREKKFAFDEKETAYLNERVKMIDSQGMFSEDTIGTYDKIIETGGKNGNDTKIE
jgi:hypothetical protein